jgi:hypothetical protein
MNFAEELRAGIGGELAAWLARGVAPMKYVEELAFCARRKRLAFRRIPGRILLLTGLGRFSWIFQ